MTDVQLLARALELEDTARRAELAGVTMQARIDRAIAAELRSLARQAAPVVPAQPVSTGVLWLPDTGCDITPPGEKTRWAEHTKRLDLERQAASASSRTGA